MREAFGEIERRADIAHPRLSFAESQRIEGSRWSRLVDAGLLRRTENASWVECASCGEEEDVVWARGTAEAPALPYTHCSEFGVLPVEPERIAQWEVDLLRVAEWLAEGLGSGARVEELVTGRLWLLGRVRVGRQPHEVLLARRLAWPDGRDAVRNCARIAAAISPVVLVAGILPRESEWGDPAPRFLALSSVLSGEGGPGALDLEVLAAALGESSRSRRTEPPARFPTPAGATWRDVEICFLDTQTVAVRVGTEHGRYTYAQMGMADGRTAAPTEQWKLLHLLAESHGWLDWGNRGASRRLKKRCERLVADLRGVFGIEDGAPVEYCPADKGWRTVLVLCT